MYLSAYVPIYLYAKVLVRLRAATVATVPSRWMG